MSNTHPRQTINPPGSTRVQSDASPPQTMEFSNDSTNPSFGPPPPGGVPGYPFLSLPQAEDEIGRLGDYRILKKLGEGGMGFVFRGEDPGLKRSVALKVMRPEVAAKPLATDRFLREGRAAAGLKSDHIITIYQVGQANGVPFLAMEFLEGLPLDEWIKQQQKAIPLPHVLRVVRDTLRGLAVAHDKGLIHRDIKPANLWLEKGTARIKLLDFGLTRGTDADMQLTQEGAVVGTPAFMAPEQASGKPVDPRADLFSVGTVMYLLLAGKNPFARGSLMETLGAVGFETQAPVASVRPDVPKPYSDFLDRLLAKSPDGRPANAKAALQELATIEKGLAESAKTLTSSQPMVAVPLSASAAAPQVWGELEDETEPTVRVPKSAPAGPKPPANKTLLYGGGLFAFLLLLGGIVIIITNKDGTQTKMELPDGAKVEVKDKGKTVASVGGKKAPPRKVAMDADRRAAEFVLGKGGKVRLDGGRVINDVQSLPGEPFKLVVINCWGVSLAVDELLPHLNGIDLIELDLQEATDADVAKLANAPIAGTIKVLSVRSSRLTDAAFEPIPKFTKLETLSFEGSTAITGSGLKHLKGMPLIHQVSLGGCGPVDANLSLLKDLPQLKMLYLTGGTQLTNAGLKTIGELERLDFLNLEANKGLTDEGLKQLVNISKLQIAAIPFSKVGFAELVKLPKLKHVMAYRAPEYTDDVVAPLAGSGSLQHIDLSWTPITDATLTALAKCKSLKEFGILSTKVTAAGVEAFRKARPDVTVYSDFAAAATAADPDRTAAEKLLPFVDLDIRLAGRAEAVKLKVGSPLPAEKFVVTGVSISNGAQFPRTFGQDVLLPAVAPLSNLLTLKDTSLKVEMAGTDVAKWSGLASRESLTNFELAVPLSDAWIDAFARFPKLTGIHVLNAKTVPTPVLRRLSELKALNYLKLDRPEGKDKWESISALPLKSLGVSIAPDMDAAVCSRIAAMPKLEYLALYGVSITVEMLTALEPAPSLKTLSFTRCTLPAKGFDSLSKLRNLGSLGIKSNDFDDGRLAQLAGADQLLYLNVRETGVTEAGLKALATKLPNCEIVWKGGTMKGR